MAILGGLWTFLHSLPDVIHNHYRYNYYSHEENQGTEEEVWTSRYEVISIFVIMSIIFLSANLKYVLNVFVELRLVNTSLCILAWYKMLVPKVYHHSSFKYESLCLIMFEKLYDSSTSWQWLFMYLPDIVCVCVGHGSGFGGNLCILQFCWCDYFHCNVISGWGCSAFQ